MKRQYCSLCLKLPDTAQSLVFSPQRFFCTEILYLSRSWWIFKGCYTDKPRYKKKDVLWSNYLEVKLESANKHIFTI